MIHTRELHIVSGELNILKRTLYPLHNMINALREYRPRKHRPTFPPGGGGTGYFPPGGGGSGYATPTDSHEKVRGADISFMAKVYLADVADHVLILTEEVDMLRGSVENMINMVRFPYIMLIYTDLQSSCSNSK
jgi:hypothetical protein